jgi:invasion protein IalB
MRVNFLSLLALTLFPAVGLAAPVPGTTFKDWIVSCEVPKEATGDDASRSEEQRRHCYIVQNLVLKEKNQRVLVIAVTYPKGKDQPIAMLTMPLGIALPPGISLSVDGDKPRRYAVDRCLASGCKAGIVLDEKLLGRFKAGNRAVVTVHDGRRNPIALPVSLQGFTAALRSLQ